MTDINLKTLTPDTSLPTTGFLFGADSQASTNPSVYSTQTVATTLLGSTSLTGDTLTADAPVLNLTQTWNSSGTTFTGMKFNVVSDTSAAASLLMDLQVGAVSLFSIGKAGNAKAPIGSAAAPSYAMGTTGLFSRASVRLNFAINGYDSGVEIGSLVLALQNTASLAWASGTLPSSGQDTFLTRSTKNTGANIQLGEADAAAPVAQKLSVQSVVAGTSNTAGQNFTITGSQGTGTGAGGSLIFQVATAGSSGTAQNALANAMVIDSVKTVRLGTGYTVATLPAAGTAGRRTYVTDALAPTFLGALTGGGAVVSPVFDNGTAWVSA